MWFGRGTGSSLPVEAPLLLPPTETTEAGLISVHVAGWVAAPGVVEVVAGGRISDAVAAAGGVRPGADLSLINLAQVLTDGQQVVVPAPGVGPTPQSQAGAPGGGPLSLNAATAQDLEQLPGVGPVLAERIVAHREARGGFDQVEDLLEVSGIGESKLASIRDLVVP